jgi:lipopolysaccharide transport system permease protein
MNREASSVALATDSASPTYFRVQATTGLGSVDVRSVWEFRDLLFFLTWRDISIRYKQTLLGAAWTILQPLLTMVLFTIVFGNFAKMPSDGLPYSIFAFAALVPWTYFSQAISRSSVSLVSDPNLIKKVYFPRLLIPLSGAMAPLVDFFVCLAVLLVMMGWYGIPLRWSLLAVPVLLLATLMAALAVGVWLAPLNARYRDIAYAVPFLTQFWFYASPITYPLSLVPAKWRVLYSLNPIVGLIEGFRWALLGTAAPDPRVLVSSGLVVVVLLACGVMFFEWMERTLSDVI